MNAVLLITKYNADQMVTLSEELAESQDAPNTGKLLILGAYYIDEGVLRKIAENLKDCFEVSEIATIQTSENQSPHTQLATMISTFIMQRYTTVPGPWLIFDDRIEIVHPNPLSRIEKIHNANAAENSGRASAQGGGRVCVGPVVVGADVRKLKTLRTVSGESWRQRGRWAFNVASWYQMSAEEYPFRLPASLENESLSTEGADRPAPGEAKTLELNRTNVTKILQAVGDRPEPKVIGGTSKAGIQTIEALSADDLVSHVALTKAQSEIDAAAKVPEAGDPDFKIPEGAVEIDQSRIPKSPAELDDEAPAPKAEGGSANVQVMVDNRPKPFMRMDPSYYEKADRAALAEQVYRRSGKKPHPATKIEKLISKLSEMDLEESEKQRQKILGK